MLIADQSLCLKRIQRFIVRGCTDKYCEETTSSFFLHYNKIEINHKIIIIIEKSLFVDIQILLDEKRESELTI